MKIVLVGQLEYTDINRYSTFFPLIESHLLRTIILQTYTRARCKIIGFIPHMRAVR